MTVAAKNMQANRSPTKAAGKVLHTKTKPSKPSLGKKKPVEARQAKRAVGRSDKHRAKTSVEEDLSDLVPTAQSRDAILKLAKVDPSWLEDDYADTKAH
jgi:hypothetical protein